MVHLCIPCVCFLSVYFHTFSFLGHTDSGETADTWEPEVKVQTDQPIKAAEAADEPNSYRSEDMGKK